MGGVFRYVNPPTICWGPRSLERLAEELDRLGVRKPFVVTTRSVAASQSVMTRLVKAAGRDFVGEPAVIGQHAPEKQVECAIEAARAAQPDGVLSIGGGSPIDAAKMVAFELGGTPHVAVPTTLSAAELAPSAGVTDQAGRKGGKRDPRLTPSAVIYDAELTLHTPLGLWLSTGIRALDHAVETILESGEHPYSDTLALEAVRRLFASLPQAKARPGALEVRTENQIAAWLSYSLPQAAGGLSHMLGKQIGSPYGIPHGVTSCLLLPHVMRYRARSEAERLARLAPPMAAARPSAPAVELASAAADAVYALIRKLGLPQHLSAYHLTDDQLRAAAEPLASDRYPLDDLLAIYRAAA
ncbi:MAG TPA: iron-containing alcohol dehydrogenase [Chloroflexota bacterium]|nr:iron-containing alcohol dehydrogenase [Chloroflexota bacterium]